jgi:hypothetical protein
MSVLRVAIERWANSDHDQSLPVIRCGRPGMADKAGDLLDGDTCDGQQRDEAVRDGDRSGTVSRSSGA